MLFFRRRLTKSILSDRDKKRIGSIPRFCKTEVDIFGVTLFVNDTCTFISDLNQIIDKEIYRFQTEVSEPFIIDCGANIGISIIYFKRLYPKSKIIAFEPDPVLFHMLSKNISNLSFENIELHQSAVWINNFGVNFCPEGGHSGRISNCDNDKNIVPVPSVRLKKILDSLDTVDMLKIDIEGAEAEVIFDCQETLQKCQHVFIEYHSRNDKKQELHNILKLLSDIGFRYHIHEAFKRKHPFIDSECMVDMDMQLNIFFYKEKC